MILNCMSKYLVCMHARHACMYAYMHVRVYDCMYLNCIIHHNTRFFSVCSEAVISLEWFMQHWSTTYLISKYSRARGPLQPFSGAPLQWTKCNLHQYAHNIAHMRSRRFDFEAQDISNKAWAQLLFVKNFIRLVAWWKLYLTHGNTCNTSNAHRAPHTTESIEKRIKKPSLLMTRIHGKPAATSLRSKLEQIGTGFRWDTSWDTSIG